MARKAYSDEERAQVKEALMVTMIRCIADRGLIHSSIDVLCRKWGSPRPSSIVSSHPRRSWYSMPCGTSNPSYYSMPGLDGRPRTQLAGGSGNLSENCCYGAKSGVAVLSIEEEQQVRHCLSEENFQAFRRD